MDERDEIILNALIADSRTSFVELARRLRITEAAVRKRVKNLEESGIIQHFTIKVDPAVLGYNSVAIIGMDTDPGFLPEIYGALRRVRNVKYVSLSSGDHMLMFEAWCKDQKELCRLISHTKKMRGVTRVCPAILLRNQ
ncbi:MAG: Lrp/AsnC family transcriptional regulator [Candidatus ainarchaeum sp.]|nr:Lrp/AsnC family transcriptional regulator [Candidatus ainarchaeum sp.]